MFKAERAIIMAAGFGNRMKPVTLTTPKPLVTVNGVRMIDTVIQGLHHNGIREIYVVVGYLKEQFAGLEREYPGLRLIENPYYSTCNNISSRRSWLPSSAVPATTACGRTSPRMSGCKRWKTAS